MQQREEERNKKLMIRIEVLSVDNSAIRARMSHQGSVEYLCLNDIVKYLDRAEMIESGRVLKICKSVTRHPFKDGGRNRWAIKPYDIHYLINEVSGENGLIEDKCLRLQDWEINVPYRQQQYVVSDLRQREDGKVYPFGTVKRWTQAGREYIIELWNEKSGI